MAASEPCSLLLSTEDHMTISAQPTAGLSYDPSEAKYWDENGLRAEIFAKMQRQPSACSP